MVAPMSTVVHVRGTGEMAFPVPDVATIRSRAKDVRDAHRRHLRAWSRYHTAVIHGQGTADWREVEAAGAELNSALAILEAAAAHAASVAHAAASAATAGAR